MFRECILLQSIGNSSIYAWNYSPFILDHDSASTLAFPSNSTMFYVTNNDGACFKSDSIYVFVDSNIPQPSFIHTKIAMEISWNFMGILE